MDPFSPECTEPFAPFREWLARAIEAEPNDPTAMALATVNGSAPSIRMVLLKGVDEHGFVFYTNANSRKGVELTTNPHAALCFHWKSLRLQVRVEGVVNHVSDEEADAYFSTRSRESQLGAWASDQSQPIASREALEQKAREFDGRFPNAVPRPPHWTGFRLHPSAVEFWRNGAHRLHDRMLFRREGSEWIKERLSP